MSGQSSAACGYEYQSGRRCVMNPLVHFHVGITSGPIPAEPPKVAPAEMPTPDDIQAIARLIEADGVYARGHMHASFFHITEMVRMKKIIARFLDRFGPPAEIPHG